MPALLESFVHSGKMETYMVKANPNRRRWLNDAEERMAQIAAAHAPAGAAAHALPDDTEETPTSAHGLHDEAAAKSLQAPPRLVLFVPRSRARALPSTP